MKNTQLSPILDDQPAQKDHLDFQSYCQALKNLIVHPSTKTPLTLGVFGRWGTGKTTLMRMLEDALKAEGIATVWFNAWQYGKEDELWAAFLQSILNKMRDDLHLFQEIRFGIKLLWNRTDWRNALEHMLQYLLRILVVVSPIIVTWPLAQQIGQDAYEVIVRVGGGAVSAGLGLWVFVKPLIEAVRQNITIDFSAFQQVSDYKEHIAFLDKFREHFEDIVQSLPQKGEKRLAVFIDDLDRCSPERTLQVLDAIKLFVDIRGCIYILGLDLDIVQKAVAIKYKDDPVAQREYLGKIIQLPFQLPPLTRDEMRYFVERIVLELPDPRCREVFVEGLVVNPREVKRTINVFSLLWNLAATRRELAGLITPVRLAKVVVIQHAHSDLHRLLQQRPYLLIELERFFRQEQTREPEQWTGEELGDSGERTETEEAKEEIALASATELPPELQPFTKREALRCMLLLHELEYPEEDDANFGDLEPEAVGVYFTLTSLTSRAEARVERIPDYIAELEAQVEELRRSKDFLGYGQLAELEAREEKLRWLKDSLEQERLPSVLRETNTYEYELKERRRKRIALITGNIRKIKVADIWVNSTNTNMQLSYERSISAIIRHLGAKKDNVGNIVEDVIANELAMIMGDNLIVQPATVLVTGAGELQRTHNVKKIFHVASVYGEIGVGYKPINNIEYCVTNALQKADSEEFRSLELKSILFPLLGTGTAKGSLKEIAEKLIHAAILYMETTENSTIEYVYFLTWTDVELDTCRVILEESDKVLEV